MANRRRLEGQNRQGQLDTRLKAAAQFFFGTHEEPAKEVVRSRGEMASVNGRRLEPALVLKWAAN